MFFGGSKNEKLAYLEKKSQHIENLMIESERTKNNLSNLVSSVNDLTKELVDQLRNEIIQKDNQLSDISEISADAIFLCNSLGVIIRQNKRAEQLMQTSEHTSNIIWDCIDAPRRDWLLFEQDSSVFNFTTNAGRIIESSIDITTLDRVDGEKFYIIMINTNNEPWLEHQVNNMKGSLLVTNGIITGSNMAAEHSLKYGVEELLGKHLIDIIDQDDREFIAKFIILAKRVSTMDCCLLTKDGQKLFCRITTSFFNFDDKFILMINNIGADQASRQSNFVRFMGKEYEFNSMKFDSTKSEYFMTLNPNLSVKFMNNGMKELYCFDEPEGKKLSDLMQDEEYEIAKMHFNGLTVRDSERLISICMTNQKSKTWIDWLDQAFFDEEGNILEYRRSSGN